MQIKNKKLIVVLLFCLTSTFVKAQIQKPPSVSHESDIADKTDYNGVIYEHYKNGNPRLKKILVNGKAHGLWMEWYPDGVTRFKAYWKDGLGHGRWEYFHPSGRLQSESFYINDIAQGIYRSYYDNGLLQNDATFINGKKVGEERFYDVNGSLKKRNFYENGELVTDQAVLFEEGVISDGKSNVWGICFMPDGNTAYFTKRDASTKQKKIYEIKKTSGGWSKPVIAPFSTDEDEAPFVNKEGNKLFFASYRPLPDASTTQKYDSNIWYVNKTDAGWSQPIPISGKVNQSRDEGEKWPIAYEAGPMVDKAGNLYYWTKGINSNATGLYFSAYLSDGTYGTPEELTAITEPSCFDSGPILSPDENVLFFTSDNRVGGLGGSDIFYSKKVNGAWSKPKCMEPFIINSYYDDAFVSFSPDGKFFFFSSNKAGNKDENGELIWDLYHIETSFLFIE